MAYQDGRCKRSNEVKVRLDDYDQQRLENHVEKFGGEKSVIGRDALIAYLDQAGEMYNNPERNLLLKEREEVRQLKAEIRKLHKTLGKNEVDANQQKLQYAS